MLKFMLIVAIVSMLLVVAPMNAEIGQLLFNYFRLYSIKTLCAQLCRNG